MPNLWRRWIPTDADLRHVAHCQCALKNCSHCSYLNAKKSGMFPWLGIGPNGIEHGFQCAYCKRAKLDTSWGLGTARGSMLWLTKLKKHEKNFKHVAARTAQIVKGKLVPPTTVFEGVLRELERGTFSPGAIAKALGVSRYKVQQVKWCIGEGYRTMNLHFLRTPGLVMTLMQDARKQWLIAMYQACDDNLDVMSGVLMMQDLRLFGPDLFAENIKEAAMRALTQCCTPLSNAPGRKTAAQPNLEALAEICESVEVFNADAAADEQLVGDMLVGRKLEELEVDVSLLPNMILSNKDKAHASRRLTMRGWNADPYLKKINLSMTGKGTFAQRIHYSGPLQTVFRSFTSGASDIGTHAIRWERNAKLYRRRVQEYDAFLASAHVVQRGRHGKADAKSASAFLEDEDTERALQAAMMGDSADENLMLTRQFDCTNYDKAHGKFKFIQGFLQRSKSLFVEGLCFETGLTKIMLEKLKKQRLLTFQDGTVTTVGGPDAVTDEMKRRCLGRMAAYHKMAEEIAAAEWPSYELLHEFWFLDLEPFCQNAQHHGVLDDALLDAAMERFCKVLQLPKPQLKNEYHFYLPIAIVEKKKGCTNFQAWKAALTYKVRGDASFGMVLRQIVKRFGGWTGTSSGCERHLSDQFRIASPTRGCLGEGTFDTEALILAALKLDQTVRKKLVEYGKMAFAEVYGNTRAPNSKRRRDAGQTHKSQTKCKLSEKDWIKKRRLEVASKMSQGTTSSRMHANPDDYWTDTHESEVKFQRRKQNNELMRAYEGGVLLDGEVRQVADIDAKLLAFQMNRAQNDLARVAKHTRQNLQRKPHKARALTDGTSIFIEAGVDHTQSLLAATRRLNLTNDDDRRKAVVFVVPDVGNLNKLSSWCLALSGGIAASPEYITSGLKTGVALAFKAALQTPRRVGLTDNFKLAHPRLADILEFKISAASSKWRLEPADNVLVMAQTARPALLNQLILLVTIAEQRLPAMRPVKLKLTATDFLLWATAIDETGSCRNIFDT